RAQSCRPMCIVRSIQPCAPGSYATSTVVALSRRCRCRSVRCVATKKKSKAASPSIKPLGPPPARADLLERLTAAIPHPKCELDHVDGWTLLIATILSAQSTDRTVNTVTPLLFSKWPTPAALASAPREAVEEVVHRTGFFRNKAKAIQGASL